MYNHCKISASEQRNPGLELKFYNYAINIWNSDYCKKIKSYLSNSYKEKCISIGANAVIGVDFDITTFSNNIIAVSANGTAVVIKKIFE